MTRLVNLRHDIHGNMVATVAKGSSGTSWTIQDERSYDVWGSVRSGNATGGPRGRYCANLGHVQDDESGLVYMRARYYEPGSGRFISEDPAMDGANWYIYCRSNPVKYADFSGKSPLDDAAKKILDSIIEIGAIGFAVAAGLEIKEQVDSNGRVTNWIRVGAKGAKDMLMGAIAGFFTATLLAEISAASATGWGVGPVIAVTGYALMIVLFLVFMDLAIDGLIDGAMPS